MGVYDTIRGKCPTCDNILYFQSKSGPCQLEEYDIKEAPDDVMWNANRHCPIRCRACGLSVYVDVEIREATEEEISTKFYNRRR